MSKLHYFAYGSNLHPNWLNNRVPSAESIAKVSKNKWRIYFNKQSSDDGSAKCNIIKTGSSDDIVHGVIYQFNADEKLKLDRAEGGYYSKKLKFDEFNDVFVYLAKEENINNNLLPYTWYKDIIILGAKYHKLPEEYIAFINSFNATIDPDQEREKKKKLIICSKNLES